METIRKASILRSGYDGSHAVVGVETNGRGAARCFIERDGRRTHMSGVMSEALAIDAFDKRVGTGIV